MKSIKYTIVMYEAKPGVPGMYTTHQSKEIMCNLLSEKLDNDAVCFYKHLVSVSQKRDKIISDLCTQVQNYNIVYAVPDKMAHFQSSKKTFSGKHHGNDDMAVMLQFNLLAHQRFFRNHLYNKYW